MAPIRNSAVWTAVADDDLRRHFRLVATESGGEQPLGETHRRRRDRRDLVHSNKHECGEGGEQGLAGRHRATTSMLAIRCDGRAGQPRRVRDCRDPVSRAIEYIGVVADTQNRPRGTAQARGIACGERALEPK